MLAYTPKGNFSCSVPAWGLIRSCYQPQFKFKSTSLRSMFFPLYGHVGVHTHLGAADMRVKSPIITLQTGQSKKEPEEAGLGASPGMKFKPLSPGCVEGCLSGRQQSVLDYHPLHCCFYCDVE